MTREVRVCHPQQSISECASAMARMHVGALPVAEGDHLVGIITDRDIAVRAVASGKGPQTPIGDVMSRELLFCFDDQELGHVARSMGLARVRRVPVVSRGMRLVGILSLADIALKQDAEIAAHAVGALSHRGGPHSQS